MTGSAPNTERWCQLDSGAINDRTLDLHRCGYEFMIRVDGLEPMNSRWHRSEDELALAAFQCESEGAEFIELTTSAGFETNCRPVPVGRREHRHFIYCCSMPRLRTLRGS